MDLRDLWKDIETHIDKKIKLEGWIRNHRDQKTFGFIDFSDGTCFKHLQVVYDKDIENFDEIKNYQLEVPLK